MKQKLKKWRFVSGLTLIMVLLFSSFTSASLQAQQRVSGTITDVNGLPLPGVNVLQKGTNKGSVTDFDGKYDLLLGAGTEVLVFSYLGYETKEVTVGSKSTINVTLDENIEGLDEVVVIGFQSVKREKILGAVETIKAEDIAKAAPVDALQGIQGQLSGVQVISNNGPGEGFDIRIRGLSTLSAGATGPLYVVDGQQTFDIDNLDPNDIESLEVIKDGATAAIYGAQGGNGVVIIKTKSGKAGKLNLDITTVTGMNQLVGELPAPNAAQRLEQERRQGITFGPILRDSLSLVTRNSPDLQRLVTRPAARHQTNVAVSGGGDKASFYWNTGFLNEDGIIINSGFKRINTRLKVDVKPNDKLKLGSLINLSFEHTNGIDPGPVLGALLNRIAYLPLFEPDGSFTPGSPRKFSLNPIQNATLRKNERDRYRGNIFTYAQYQLAPSLSIRSQLGLDFSYDKRETFVPAILDPRNFADGNTTGGERHTLQTRIQQDNTLNFNQNWGKHELGAFAGMQIQRSSSENLNLSGRFANDLIETLNNVLIADEDGSPLPLVDATGGDATLNQKVSVFSLFGGFNYDFDNKYLIGATIRRDGSSNFGGNNKFGYFPSGNIGWRVSKENFLNNSDVVKNFLIRASFGITGNDRGGAFTFLSSLVPGAIYNGASGFAPLRLGNADLRWEETESLNLGFDLSLFKGRRLNISFEYYDKLTDGILVDSRVPQESGFSSIRENRGVIQNKGIDLNINGTIIKTKNFTWDSGFNIGFVENEVVELEDEIRQGRFVTREGEPIGNIWGYKNLGVFQYDESNAFTPEGNQLFPNFDANGFFTGSYNRENGEVYPVDGEIRQLVHGSSQNTLRGGDYFWDDVNGDFIIDGDDEQILGNGLPTVFGGFTHNFKYKNWTLSTLFDYSFGNDIYRRYDHDRNSLRASVLTVSPDRLNNAWQNQGDIAQFPTIERGGDRLQNRFDFTGSTANSTYVSDGSFIKWRFVRLGYDFPKETLENLNIGMKKLSLNFAINNLLTWTNYPGYNPEFGTRGNPLTPSEDALRYPNDREILLTLRAQF